MERPRSAISSHVKSVTQRSRGAQCARKGRATHEGQRVPVSESRLTVTHLCKAWGELRGCEPAADLARYVHALFCNTVRFTLSHQWKQIRPNQRVNLRRSLLLFNSRACQTFAGLLPEPWGDAYALAAMRNNYMVRRDLGNANRNEPAAQFPHLCTDACYLEPRDVKRARIELLCYAGCKNEALRLCLFYRRCPVLAADHFIAESALQLLYHMGSVKHMIDEMESFSCHDGFQLIQLILQKEGAEMHPLVECLTQILLVRDLVGPSTYCCTVSLMNLWCLLHVKQKTDLEDVTREVHKLGALATTSAHLYLLVDVLYKQYGRRLLPLYLNLYIHALTIDVNNLEYARQVDCRVAVAELETHMAGIYTKLASLLAADEDLGLARECVLTAFSLEPTVERLERLHKWAEVRPPMWSYHHVVRPVPCEGECHCSEKGLCRQDPPVPSWFMTHVPNGILDSNLDGVSRQLLQDLCILVEGPRCRSLTWNMPWEKLCGVCVYYLQTSHAHRAEVDDRCVGIEARLRRLGPFSSSLLPSFEVQRSAPLTVRKEVGGGSENRDDMCNITTEENQRFVVPPLVIKKSAFDPEFSVVDRTNRPLLVANVVNTASPLPQCETRNDFHCDSSSCPKDSRGSPYRLQDPRAKKEINTDGCIASPEAVRAAVRGSTTDIMIGLENYVNYDSGQDCEPFTDDPNTAEVESLLNYKIVQVEPALNSESLQLSLENNASNETPDPMMTSVPERTPLSTVSDTATMLVRASVLHNSKSTKAKSESCLPITRPAFVRLEPARIPPRSRATFGLVHSKQIEAVGAAEQPSILSYPEHNHQLSMSSQRSIGSVKEHLDRLNMLSILAAERSDKLRCAEVQAYGSVATPSNPHVAVKESLSGVGLLKQPPTGQKFTDENCKTLPVPCSHTAKMAASSAVLTNTLQGKETSVCELIAGPPESATYSQVAQPISKPMSPFFIKRSTTQECLISSKSPSASFAPPSTTSPHEQSRLCKSLGDALQTSSELTGPLEVTPAKHLGSLVNPAEEASAADGLSSVNHLAEQHLVQGRGYGHHYSNNGVPCKMSTQEDIRFEEEQAVQNLIAQQTANGSNEPTSKPEACAEADQSFTTDEERNEATSRTDAECSKTEDKLMELLRSFDLLPLKESSGRFSSQPESSSDQALMASVMPDSLVTGMVKEIDKAKSPTNSNMPTVPITLESLVAETLQVTPSGSTSHRQSSSTTAAENYLHVNDVVLPSVSVGMPISDAALGLTTSVTSVTKEMSHRVGDGLSSDYCNWKNLLNIDCNTSTLIPSPVPPVEASVGAMSVSQAMHSVPSVTFHQTYATCSAANITTHSLPTVVYASSQQPHSSLLDHMYGEPRLHHILTVQTPPVVSAIPQHVAVTSVPSVTQVDGVSIIGQHPAVFGGAPTGLQAQSVLVALPQTSVAALPVTSNEERVITTNQILHTVPFTSSANQPHFQQVTQTPDSAGSLILQQGGVVQTHMGLSRIHIGPALGMGLAQIQIEPITTVELSQPSTISAHRQVLAETTSDSSSLACMPPVQISTASRPTHVITLPIQSVSQPKTVSTQHVLPPKPIQASVHSAAVRPALPPQPVQITLPAGTVQNVISQRIVQPGLSTRMPVVQPQMSMMQPTISATVPSTPTNQSVRYYVHTVPATSVQGSASRELPKAVSVQRTSFENVQCVQRKSLSVNEMAPLLRVHDQLPGNASVAVTASPTTCRTTGTSQYQLARTETTSQHITTAFSGASVSTNSVPRTIEFGTPVLDSATSLRPSTPSISQPHPLPNEPFIPHASQIVRFGKGVVVNQVTGQAVQSQQNQGSDNAAATTMQCTGKPNVRLAESEACQRPFFRKDLVLQETVMPQGSKSTSPITVTMSSAGHIPQVESTNSSPPLEECSSIASDPEETLDSSSVEIQTKIFIPDKFMCKSIAGRKLILAQRKDRKWMSVRSAHGVMGYRKVDCDELKLAQSVSEASRGIIVSAPALVPNAASIPISKIVTASCATSTSGTVTDAVLPLSATTAPQATTVTSVALNVPLVKKCYSPAVLNHALNASPFLSNVATSENKPTMVGPHSTLQTALVTSAVSSSPTLMPTQDSARTAQSTSQPMVAVQARPVAIPVSQSLAAVHHRTVSVPLQNSPQVGQPKTVTIGSRVLTLLPKSVVLPVHPSVPCAQQKPSTVHPQPSQPLHTQMMIQNSVPSAQSQMIAADQQPTVSQSKPMLVSIQKSAHSTQVTVPPSCSNSAQLVHPLNSTTGHPATLSQSKLVLAVSNSVHGTQSKFVIRTQPASAPVPVANVAKVIQSTQLKQVLIPSHHSSLVSRSKTGHLTAAPQAPAFAHTLPPKGFVTGKQLYAGQATSAENVLQGLESKPSASGVHIVPAVTRTSAPVTGVVLHSPGKATKPLGQPNLFPTLNLKSGLSTFVSIAKSYLVKNKEKTIVQLSPLTNTATATTAVCTQTAPVSSDSANRTQPSSDQQSTVIPPNSKRKLDNSLAFSPRKMEKKQCHVCQKLLSSSHCLRRHLSAVHHVTFSNSATQSELPKNPVNANRHEKATKEQVDLLVKSILMKSRSLSSTAKSSTEATVHSKRQDAKASLQPGESAVEAKAKLPEQATEAQSSEQTIKAELQPSGHAAEVKTQSIWQTAEARGTVAEAKASMSGQPTEVKVRSSEQATDAEFHPSGDATEPKVQLNEQIATAHPQSSGQTVEDRLQSGEQVQSSRQAPAIKLELGGKATLADLETIGQARVAELQHNEHTTEARPQLNLHAAEVQTQPCEQPDKVTHPVPEIPCIELLVVSGPLVDNPEPPPVLDKQSTSKEVSEQPLTVDSNSSTCEQQAILSEEKNLTQTESVQESVVEDEAVDNERTKQPTNSEMEPETTEAIELSSEEEEEEQMPLLLPVVALTPIDFDAHYGKELSPPKIEMVAMQPTVGTTRESRELRGRASSRAIKPAQKRCCPCCENTSPNSSNKRQCRNERSRRSSGPTLRKTSSPKSTRRTRASGRNSKT